MREQVVSEPKLDDRDPNFADLPAKAAGGAMVAAGALLAVTSLAAVTLTATGAHFGLNLVRAAMPRVGRAGLLKGRGRLP